MFFRVIKILALFLFSIIAIFPLTYFFGFFYKLFITHPVGGFFWGVDPYYLFSFVCSIILVICFLFSIFLSKKNIVLILILLNIFIIYYFWSIDIIDIILLISASLLGSLLGFISKIFYNQLSVNK